VCHRRVNEGKKNVSMMNRTHRALFEEVIISVEIWNV
jgi:hypothetical protein